MAHTATKKKPAHKATVSLANEIREMSPAEVLKLHDLMKEPEAVKAIMNTIICAMYDYHRNEKTDKAILSDIMCDLYCKFMAREVHEKLEALKAN